MQERSSRSRVKVATPMDGDMSKTEPIAQEQRIEELEKQLKNVQLQLEASELTIDIAEKEFKIPSQVNQIWVSYITYWKAGWGYIYISLITDAYSHKIVGYWSFLYQATSS